jgi:hypothetical protein
MNEENKNNSALLKQINEDTQTIRNYMRILARVAISATLREITKTPERRQMWRLFDGTKSTEQIAKEIAVSTRSVQYFVQDAEDAGLLVTEKRGYPKRVENVIPSEWKPWKSKTQAESPIPNNDVVEEEK